MHDFPTWHCKEHRGRFFRFFSVLFAPLWFKGLTGLASGRREQGIELRQQVPWQSKRNFLFRLRLRLCPSAGRLLVAPASALPPQPNLTFAAFKAYYPLGFANPWRDASPASPGRHHALLVT